jgi:hypothetical protein
VVHDTEPRSTKVKSKISEHELESADTQILGFLAQKLLWSTHLRRLTAYLKSKFPMTMPNFILRSTYPKTVNGFEHQAKTEVVGICTAKTDAASVDAAFTKLFLADTAGEFYVSFLHDTEKDILCTVYGRQNQWLQTIKTVTISEFGNIDRQYDIGISQKLSFHEFMREQLTHDKKLPIDVENGGDGGCTQVIFMPEHQDRSKQLYKESKSLITKQQDATSKMDIEDDTTANHSNASAYKDRLREIFGHAVMEAWPKQPHRTSTNT